MEAEKERTRHGGGVNEEKRNESSGAYEEGGYTEEIVIKVKLSSLHVSSDIYVEFNFRYF